jgi:transposase
MPLAQEISLQEIELLEAIASKIKGRREYRRLQSVLLRAKENKSPEEIGKILGIHPRTVQKHHQRYFRQSFKAFEEGIPGPKGPKLLSKEAEAEFFDTLKEEAGTGQLLKASQIKPLYEAKAGKTCSYFTIYAALKRNNWSKKQPRPRHPKGNEEAKYLFKKTI